MDITESTIMAEGADETIRRLSELSITLSIDDFGTGYSSLAYLGRLPVQKIKIDRSFVLDLLSKSEAATIVHSVIELGHRLSLKVVAEGIENAEVWLRLTSDGCRATLVGEPSRR